MILRRAARAPGSLSSDRPMPHGPQPGNLFFSFDLAGLPRPFQVGYNLPETEEVRQAFQKRYDTGDAWDRVAVHHSLLARALEGDATHDRQTQDARYRLSRLVADSIAQAFLRALDARDDLSLLDVDLNAFPDPGRRTVDEHLAWAKARALEYAETGDLTHAATSLASDLSKHDGTRKHPAAAGVVAELVAGRFRDADDFRAFLRRERI